MFETFLKDPKTWSVVTLLAVAVAAFYLDKIRTAAACERELTKQKEQYDERLKIANDRLTDMREQFLRALEERDEFKEMAHRGLELTRLSINVAEKKAKEA
jgi:hypothetical protein